MTRRGVLAALVMLATAAVTHAQDRVMTRYLLARRAFLRGEIARAHALYDEAARVPAGTPELQARALARLNEHRRAAMLVPLVPDRRVARAAAAHARYLDRHHDAEAELGLEDAHTERPGTDGYTGEGPAERIAAQGHRGGATEGVTSVTDPAEAIDHLVNSVYHRTGLLRPEARYFGIGVGARAVVNLAWGRGDLERAARPVAGSKATLVWSYPGPGQAGVPPRFPAGETPNPLPDGEYPVGPPLSVATSEGAPTILEARLEGPGGAVPLRVLGARNAPRVDLMGDWAYVVPLRPLEPETTYRASLVFEAGGRRGRRRWAFTTGADVPGEEIYEVRITRFAYEPREPVAGGRMEFHVDVESNRPEVQVRWTVGGEVLQDGPRRDFFWRVPAPGWYEIRATAHLGEGIEAFSERAEFLLVPGPNGEADTSAMPTLEEMRRRSPGKDLWAVRIQGFEVTPTRFRAGDTLRFDVALEATHPEALKVRWKVDGQVVLDGQTRSFSWTVARGEHSVAVEGYYPDHPGAYAESVREFHVP